jgi:hypothetical protein
MSFFQFANARGSFANWDSGPNLTQIHHVSGDKHGFPAPPLKELTMEVAALPIKALGPDAENSTPGPWCFT